MRSLSHTLRQPAWTEHPVVRRVTRWRWTPLLALILLSNVALFGSLLWGSGLPKGTDMNASLITGYEARDGAWHQLWDDSRFPGMPKHVSRFATSELVLTWINEVTRDPILSARLMVWGLNVLALVTMYLFAFTVTRSRVAGVVAAGVYVFSRGSLLQIGVPLAAGFALAPLLFLAVDRTLHEPSFRRALLLALAVALFVTATIPGFTYIVGIALAVYVGSFYVARATAPGRRIERLKTLPRPTAFVVLALAIAVALSAYYATGLALSTAPLVSETGGYDLNTLGQNLPSLQEAVTLSRSGFRFGTTAMDVTAWLLVAAAALASLLRVHFRVIALFIIAAGAVFFASNVESPAYGFLLDTLPNFSLVRGAARWMALALFSYAMLIAIGVAAAIDFAQNKRRFAHRFWNSRRTRIFGSAAAAIAIAIVLANVGTQLSGIRQWATPYQVPVDELQPFEAIADAAPGGVFATTPFLAGRIFGPPHLSAIDFGRTLGPAVSGHTTLGGFRVGGLDTGDDVLRFIQDLQVPEPRRLERLTLGEAPARLAGPTTDFRLLAHIAFGETSSPEATLQVRFHERANNPYYTLAINPTAGRIELARSGASLEPLASAYFEPDAQQEYDLEISAEGPQIDVLLNGKRVLETPNATPGSGRITALSSEVSVTLSDVEVVSLSRTANRPDATVTKVMSNFNVRYFVVQPDTSEVERLRIAELPGLRKVGEWGAAELYENAYYLPGKFYFSPNYGVYLGEAAKVIPALYNLDSLALSKVGLVGLDDLTAELQQEVKAGAWFTAIDARSDYTLRASVDPAQPDSRLPPLVYVSDLTTNASEKLRRPYPVPSSLIVTEPVRLVPRARNFVLETRVAAVLDSSALPLMKIDFRVQNTRDRYTLEIDGDSRRLAVVRHGVDGPVTLGSVALPELRSDVVVRTAVEDDRFRVYVDDAMVIEVSDSVYPAVGAIDVSSKEPGVLIQDIGFASDRDGQMLRDRLAELGFDFRAILETLPDLGRDHFGLFPNTTGYSARMRGIVEGTYRILIGAADLESRLIISTVEGGNERLRPRFNRVHVETQPGDDQKEQVWFVSEPLDLKAGTFDVFVALRGVDARVSAIMLVEAATAPNGQELVDAILTPPAPLNVDMSRHSATSYSGAFAGTEGGILTFQESFDEGWDAQLGGKPLAQFRVFGTLNGFWIPPERAVTGERLEVKFTPQTAYRWSMALSGISFLVVLGLLVRKRIWQLVRRRFQQGRPGRLDAKG